MNVSPELNKLQSLFPLEISKAQKGHGSFLTFDLCEKTSNKKILHLWVYLCKWSLFINKQKKLTSTDTKEKLYDEILDSLVGCVILSIEELTTKEEIEIIFNNESKLTLSKDLAFFDNEDDFLIAYLENGENISYSPQKGFYLDV